MDNSLVILHLEYNFLNHNGPGITFQQDNARPHTARITQAFLQQQNIDDFSFLIQKTKLQQNKGILQTKSSFLSRFF